MITVDMGALQVSLLKPVEQEGAMGGANPNKPKSK